MDDDDKKRDEFIAKVLQLAQGAIYRQNQAISDAHDLAASTIASFINENGEQWPESFTDEDKLWKSAERLFKKKRMQHARRRGRVDARGPRFAARDEAGGGLVSEFAEEQLSQDARDLNFELREVIEKQFSDPLIRQALWLKLQGYTYSELARMEIGVNQRNIADAIVRLKELLTDDSDS